MSPGSKSLRRYLRANNHSLVGCDVSNSQPLLVGLLCRHIKQGLSSNSLANTPHFAQFNHYEIDQALLDRISLSFPQNQEEEKGGGHGYSHYDVVFTKSSQLGQKMLEVYHLCEEGKCYDELMFLDNNHTDRETF